MSNLNKTYHKGKFRSGEWAKHLRPYLKRLGNKRFRKTSPTMEDDEFDRFTKAKKKKARKRIRAKITIRFYRDNKISYYKSYRTMRDLENAVNRPNVITYTILNNSEELVND